MISLVNVHRSFEGIAALKGVTLEVKRGQIAGLMGPGGAGKSTLCKVIVGLLKPDSGVVFVGGVDMIKADRRGLQQVQSRIGVQFQNDALFEHMTVLENVAYPMKRLTAEGNKAITYRAMERLAVVGLAGFENRFPSELSGGQRRRVALARACAADPDILICDDPTAGLDPVTSRRILDMIVGIRYQLNNTVVIVSSDVLGLLSVVDRAALVWDGLILAEDTPSAFWRDERRHVKRFVNDAKLPSTFVNPSWLVKWE
jgi:phospholipid/cholesterol/gamma-HCH transport system ATP-binding protein